VLLKVHVALFLMKKNLFPYFPLVNNQQKLSMTTPTGRTLFLSGGNPIESHNMNMGVESQVYGNKVLSLCTNNVKIRPNIMTILRPVSPHLPIYKPQLTSTFPISHRISGAFLATNVLFFYLLCMKIGLICFTYENFYQFLFYSSKLILISVEITALALSYHLYNGVRHLLTDFSFLEEKD